MPLNRGPDGTVAGGPERAAAGGPGRPVARWHAELAWLDGRVAERVLLEVDGERLSTVTEGVDPPPGATRLTGLTLPGLANTHSHAFHRALRGRAQAGRGTFWSWREQMYALAGRLDPERYLALARSVYAEMALAGITAVGEFHYLHHDRDGRPYRDTNVMAAALAVAATDAGLRLTLLDTCYLSGGFGRALEGVQRRFGDGDADRWAARAAAFADGASVRAAPGLRMGAAIHSVRAVDAPSMRVVGDWAQARGAPLHVHVSEQPAENADCVAATGRTPTALLAEVGVLGPATTAVHATHLLPGDIAALGASRTAVCLCPTTERDLADGVGPAPALAAAGSPLCLGSDSHAVVDLFEEARALELDERLVSRERGSFTPATLLAAATTSGMAALGWDVALRPGALADFVSVDLCSVRTAGATPETAAASAVFAATAADVTSVVVGGRRIVEGGEHLGLGDIGGALDTAIRALDRP